MASGGDLNPESADFESGKRPIIAVGQHDTSRTEALDPSGYKQVKDAGVGLLPPLIVIETT